jgi:pimeloyl-ACP methyl ester carboxylesterase
MSSAVGSHGFAQQQGGRLQLLEKWRPALADGLERAGEAALREGVLDRVREILALAPSPRVLIGHSLGSVVALEALGTCEDHGIDTPVTLGSPLGVRTIQDGPSQATAQWRRFSPTGVRRWVNVYDPPDPVACAGALAATWRDVSDQAVSNGADAHGVERYLGKRQTGAAILSARTP